MKTRKILINILVLILSLFFFQMCRLNKEVKPTYNPNSFINKWFLDGVVIDFGYTILEQTNSRTFDLQQQINNTTGCLKTQYYDFRQDSVLFQGNSDQLCTDSTIGKWHLNTKKDSLTISNITFVIPNFVFVELLTLPLDTNQQLPVKFKVNNLGEASLELENYRKTTLTKEIWDKDPDFYNGLFPGFYTLLPFGYQFRTKYRFITR